MATGASAWTRWITQIALPRIAYVTADSPQIRRYSIGVTCKIVQGFFPSIPSSGRATFDSEYDIFSDSDSMSFVLEKN